MSLIKPLFSATDFCSIGGNCPHTFTEDYHCSGIHEANKANAKVAPLQERIEELKALLNERKSPPSYEHAIGLLQDERFDLQTRLAAAEARLSDAEGALRDYSQMSDAYMVPPDWSWFKNGGGPDLDECEKVDVGEKARAYFQANASEHFEKYGDKP